MADEIWRAALPPTAAVFFNISVSVSTSASARVSAAFPAFRGLYFLSSTSLTVVGFNGQSLPLDNVAKNTTLWIQGSFVSVIATATAIWGLQ